MNNTFIKKLVYLFFPKRCPFCHVIIEQNSVACSSCEENLSFASCEQNVNNSEFVNLSFEKNLSVFYYKESVKNYICAFKFNEQISKGKALTQYLILSVKKYYGDIAFDLILPVPVHASAYNERQYNQAEVIAKEIALALSVPCRTDILMKDKLTKTQHSLGRYERKDNLKGAFSVCHKQDIAQKTILLVDDIITTGSTLHCCSQVLLQYGATHVFTATLALTAKGNLI